MDALAHRIAIAQRFGARIAAGDAVFQSSVTAQGLPCTLSPEGDVRTMSGANLFVLMQVMKDRGLTDPRFFTAAQAEKAGWSVNDGATGVALRYFNSVGADGLPLKNPTSSMFRVYHASDLAGVPEFARAEVATVDDLTVAMERGGAAFSSNDLLGGVCGWLAEQDAPAGTPGALRARLAAALVESQVGRLDGEEVFGKYAPDWLLEIERDPLSFFDAAKDAERMAAGVMARVREVAIEREALAQVAIIEAPAAAFVAPVESGVSDTGGGMSKQQMMEARATERFNEREAVLAVPFADKERASKLGAKYYGSQKLWYVPKGVDVNLFREWNPRENALGAVATRSALVDSFVEAMASLGLDTGGEIKADGKWHNVSVNTKHSKNNKSGSYVVNFGEDGGSPRGTILNKHTGESLVWKHDGELLTPEQRARMRAESLAREALAAREAAVIQDAAAEHAAAIWAAGRPADGHGYIASKGISPEGLRQISGSVLLSYPEYRGESGGSMVRGDRHYALVPMKNEMGDLRAVQAIDESGTKIFMRGAQKKSTMMVLGAECLDDLVESHAAAVGYVEGLATGADFRAAGGLPVVVCFDAGNMETVAKLTAASLVAAGVVAVVGADNDQFHVERAMGFLAENLGLNPVAGGGQAVEVVAGTGSLRRVELGEVVADGAWHEVAKGRYCVSVEKEEDVDAVRRMTVEVVPVGGRSVRATFENRGIEAGRVVARAMEAAGGRAVMAVPEFKSLAGRPTDWNDLVKREGLVVAKGLLKGVEGVEIGEKRELELARGLERGRERAVRGQALTR